MADVYLDTVNDNDEITGRELRSAIHRQGLMHREVWVIFCTPDQNVILQKRAPTKETFPDKLDATVGGHVELGQTYLQAAIMETEEEAGTKVQESDLIPLMKLTNISYDEVTGMYNNCFRQIYAHIYNGKASDIPIEEGQAVGFETYPLSKIIAGDAELASKCVPGLCDPEKVGAAFHKLKEKLEAA